MTPTQTAAHAWAHQILGNAFAATRHTMHPDTAAELLTILDDLRAVADERPDRFETWLRDHRNSLSPLTPEEVAQYGAYYHPEQWHHANTVLTAYRHHRHGPASVTGSQCTWYEGDPIEDVPDDYNGPCIHCTKPRDQHRSRT